jgi:hypothetical protein
MFRFTIRDVMWLTVVAAVVSFFLAEGYRQSRIAVEAEKRAVEAERRAMEAMRTAEQAGGLTPGPGESE